jgi:CHAT domain-containing protein
MANRATALGPNLSQYQIIHFATHGLLNSQHPELSGVVLSLFDEEGRPQDGFLRLHDIYNLKLAADLVVLSACKTGLGKEIKGEGLVGLTRGFFYAGAPRVVASLWKVDDRATAELMKLFYQRMLRDGLRPAEALRKAQIDMLKQPRWAAPYYWAGFTLQGEWK